MVISNSKEIRKEIQDVINTNAVNMNVADVLMSLFSYVDIIDINEIKQYLKEGWKENDAIIEMLYEYLNLDKNNKENQIVMEDYFYNNLKKLNPNDYLNNPYAKAIHKCGNNKKYALRYISYYPYQLFAYDDIKMNGYKEYSQIGYFDEKFSYQALTQGNNVWMSLNPNEIETMKPFIQKGKGNVLVLGLGMGYVPYMLSLKDDVKSITIIEKDQEVIDIFNKLIWPNFSNKNKLRIVKDDAVEFMKKSVKSPQFDYIFADLWHDPDDGLPLFVELKKIDNNIDCWLETSMFALLRRCMITLIEETLNGAKEDDYRYAKNYTDKVINLFYQKTKNLSLERLSDLDKLLSDKTLLGFLL